MRNVEMMQLSHNRLGSQGVAALSAVVRVLPSLQALYIGENNIDDEGVASLVADLGKDDFKALETIYLHDNELTDSATTTLVQAIKQGAMPALRCVELGDEIYGSDDSESDEISMSPNMRALYAALAARAN